MTGREVKLTAAVWPHPQHHLAESLLGPRMKELRQGVTIAVLSMRRCIFCHPDRTSCWPCLLLFPLARSPGSCDLFQLGQQAGDDVCVSKVGLFQDLVWCLT